MAESLTFGIIGQTGQLARALRHVLSRSNHEGIFLDRQQCDLSGDKTAIETGLEAFASVDVIIIAAAYTQVDRAETDEDAAMAVNGVAPGIIAGWAASQGIPVIFISTDYVFNGQASVPYPVDAPIDPINAYGRSKALGEQAVRAAQNHSAIIRTSWLYDRTGENFLTKMLKLASSRMGVDVVNDQIGRPAYAGHLAQAVLSYAQGLAAKDKAFTGTFHVSDSGPPTSWAGFAREIFTIFADELPHKAAVNEVTSSAFKTAAQRPAFSVLELLETESLLGHSLPDWRDGVRAAKRERQLHG